MRDEKNEAFDAPDTAQNIEMPGADDWEGRPTERVGWAGTRPEEEPAELPGSASRGVMARLLPMGLAVLGTAVTVLIARAMGEGRLNELLLDRGWTQPVTLGLFFWGIGHAVRRVLRQRAESIALEACRQIVVDQALSARNLPRLMGQTFPWRQSLPGPVLRAVLSCFRNARPTRDEVNKVATHEIERAQDSVAADYRALQAVMWLLPLSGFLGTVVGMAAAIGNFDTVIADISNDLSALAPSVAGLATAFDTTLLALALVVPLKLVEVGLEGRDQRLLERLDRQLGTGYVATLDLAGLAQQTPQEAAMDRFEVSLERIERNLQGVDRVLASIGAQLHQMPETSHAIAEVLRAAQMTNEALPLLCSEVQLMRKQGEQPIQLVRGARRVD